MGSWYWGADNIRLETGFADISRAGNSYRIEYELYNHFGVKFSGALTYINKTTNSGVKAAKVNGKSKGGLKKTIVNKPIGRQPISY
ncbi:MAG: hypothetical protein QM800_02430 [Paludibacter sp.]